MTLPISPPDPRSDERRKALDRSLVGGLAWTGGARWLTQALSWGSTVIVARLLTPSAYGIYGMALVYLGVVQLVNEFGISAALIRGKELDEQRRATLGGVAIALGVIFFLVSAAVAPLIAAFFGEPATQQVITVLAVTFVISSIKVLPYSLLAQEMRFKILARIDTAEALTQTTTTLGFAIAGYGYWSLVIGSVASALVSTAITMLTRRHRVAFTRDLRPVIEPMRLGWHVTGSRVGSYIFSNADFAVVGRVLGKAALGAYSFGWQIASMPVDKISSVLVRVAYPLFAEVRDDQPALRRYIKGLTEGLALVTFPVSFGLALVAAPLVHLALGDRWAAAINPLRLLALYASVRSLIALFPHLLNAIGHAAWNMRVSVYLATLMPIAFVIGARWGVDGVALAWVIAYPVLAIPLLAVHSLRAIGLGVTEYLATLWPATTSSLLMVVAVLAVDRTLATGWSNAAILAVRVAVGAATYGLAMLLFHRARLRHFLALMRRTRS